MGAENHANPDLLKEFLILREAFGFAPANPIPGSISVRGPCCISGWLRLCRQGAQVSQVRRVSRDLAGKHPVSTREKHSRQREPHVQRP